MRKPRIYQNISLVQEQKQLLSDEAAHHLINVLRMKTGQNVFLFNGKGGYFDATIIRAEKRTVEVLIGKHHHEENESSLRITLVQGISRGQRMDYTLQKAVELGVTDIVPVICQYGNVKLDVNQKEKRLVHWQKIIIGACEQSNRNKIPSISTPVSFYDWINIENNGLKILLHPAGKQTLSQCSLIENHVILLAGPEGGFSENEIEQATKKGFTTIILGPRVLRTETTALAAITACQVLWGDLC